MKVIGRFCEVGKHLSDIVISPILKHRQVWIETDKKQGQTKVIFTKIITSTLYYHKSTSTWIMKKMSEETREVR